MKSVLSELELTKQVISWGKNEPRPMGSHNTSNESFQTGKITTSKITFSKHYFCYK